MIGVVHPQAAAVQQTRTPVPLPCITAAFEPQNGQGERYPLLILVLGFIASVPFVIQICYNFRVCFVQTARSISQICIMRQRDYSKLYNKSSGGLFSRENNFV